MQLSLHPALQFSLGVLAKYRKQHIWVLHYVLLLSCLRLENLLAFALYIAFLCSLVGRYSHDYYANSVIWSDIQALEAIAVTCIQTRIIPIRSLVQLLSI